MNNSPIQTALKSLESQALADDEEAYPFPVDSLPPVMREMVQETCRAYSVPLALAAPCALSAVSVAIGAGVVIRSGNERILRGNTFSILLGESGSGKGETHKAIFKAIQEWESEKIEMFAKEITPQRQVEIRLLTEREGIIMKEVKSNSGVATESQKTSLFEIAKEIKELELSSGDDGSIMTRNSTSERLVAMIGSKPAGAFSVVSEEAKDPLSIIFGRYRNGGETDDSVYLTGYSCEPMNLDRRSEGGSVRTKASCLSMALMTQPSVGRKLFSTMEALESGLFARTLMVDSKAQINLLEANRKGFESSVQTQWGELLTDLLDDVRSKGETEAIVIETTSADREILVKRLNPKLKRVRDGSSVNSSIASRWAENAYKVALLLHVADGGYESLSRPFSPQTMSNALDVMEWFIVQHEFLTREVENKVRKERLEKILDILDGQESKEMTLGTLKRNHNFEKGEIERLVAENKGILEIYKKGKTKPASYLKKSSK